METQPQTAGGENFNGQLLARESVPMDMRFQIARLAVDQMDVRCGLARSMPIEATEQIELLRNQLADNQELKGL